MHGGMSGQTLQSLAHIYQIMHLLVALVEAAEFRIDFQCAVYGNIEFKGHHFRNGIYKGIGQIHHTSHIPDNALRRHSTKSHYLHHFVRTIFAPHIINHLLSSLVAEVHVDIGHGDTLRI